MVQTPTTKWWSNVGKVYKELGLEAGWWDNVRRAVEVGGRTIAINSMA